MNQPFLVRTSSRWLVTGAMAGCLLTHALSQTTSTPGPTITSLEVKNQATSIQFSPSSPPIPALKEFQIQRANTLGQPFTDVSGGTVTGTNWQGASLEETAFYRVMARQLSTNELLASTLLSRLGYGPTPDELERVLTIGPDAYIEEQLAPEKIDENLDAKPEPVKPLATPEWKYVTVTGRATKANPDFYIYLNEAGTVIIDEVRVVSGVAGDQKPNLITNGNFDADLAGSWVFADNHIDTERVTVDTKAGPGALKLVASSPGSSKESAVWQSTTGITNNQQLTLSFWYFQSVGGPSLTIRFSGGGIASTVATSVPTTPKPPYGPGNIYRSLEIATANISVLRAWHVLHAIQSRRQLLEVLRQFCENHFVTEYSKTREEFFNGKYPNASGYPERLAVKAEFDENIKWRTSLLNPQGTFHDLLKISAESPAMIVYLDTVGSKSGVDANGKITTVANENYARELCELFAFGVDNGYDQRDIVEISRAWAGWTLKYLAPENINNPLAAESTRRIDGTLTNKAALESFTNTVGTWALGYKPARQFPNEIKVFFNHDDNGNATTPKTVPARFGAPWAGRDYSLTLAKVGNNGTQGMARGYRIVEHMADQPFTQEYVCVKLCRLFVHDHFRHGYDFTDAETTPEEELIRKCMLAWETPPNGGPKGQIRDIVRTIVTSDLFRSHAGSLQKVKTPLEFGVSTIRALRLRLPDGTYAAQSNGESMYNLMNRAGRMRLFDRAEPDGYAEEGQAWISAGTLAERLRFAEDTLSANGIEGEDSKADVDVRAIIQTEIPQSMNDASRVVQLFLGLLLPAEGAANLAPYHAIGVRYLNTTDDGTASPFANLATSSAIYENRVRGMVAMLMTTQRFQEQ